MTQSDPNRLPTTVLPRRYELHLEPDLSTDRFGGRASIAVEVRETVREIVLHSLELDITEAVLEQDGSTVALTVGLDPDHERVVLGAPAPLTIGSAVLRLTWSGELGDRLVGLYRSTYTDDAGTERVLACTQFESTHARRAFPCWDEPAFKAVFELSVTVDPDLLAVSNGAEVSSETRPDGRRLVRFAPTIEMSTYLVALVVGPMESTETVDVDGVAMRVITPIGKIHLAGFALETGAAALRFLTDWYGIPYPGDKIDLVAIPDFSFGAMENQGCITFRETALLLDRRRSTRSEQMRVVDVIAHELAHMWFGNLVTMAWWEGIWLNEAFATFMELLTTDALRPEWQRWVEFGLARSAAFDTDSLTTTRPIEFDVVTAADSEAMFDILTYEKGSSLVRMLQRHLGEDRFRAAIHRYLTAHAHGNTVTADLWDAIEAETGEPVRRLMDTWILRGGHPVVSIALEGDRTLVLRQRRFTYASDPASGVTAPTETDRAVPVGLRLGLPGGPSVKRVILDRPELRIELDERPDWIIGNADGDGFYRVELPEDLLTATAAVALGELSALERYGLVEDEWALLLAGAGDPRRLLEVLRALRHDDDAAVWERVLAVLAAVDRHLDTRHTAGSRGPNGADGHGLVRDRFTDLVRSLLRPVAERLGDEPGDDEDTRTSSLRASVQIALALVGGDEDQRILARRRFDVLGEDPDAVSPELAAAAVAIVAADADEAVWDELRRRALAASDEQDRLRHHGALADARDPELVLRLAELVFTDEIRTQDGLFLLRRALANRHASAAIWPLVESRWDEIRSRFPTASVNRLLEGIRVIDDPALAARVAAFLDAHPVPEGRQVVAQHRERMWVSVAFAEGLVDRLAPALEADPTAT